jgi:hypothetical protein
MTMIQIGRSITTVGDPLQKIEIEQLFHTIKNPQPALQNKIKQLRIVRNIDVKQYTVLKKQLPYFVCAIFNPNVRRTENFAYCDCFVIDIDHISEKGFEMQSLRQKIESDSRTMLSFVSPGEDGLKVVFRLAERCYDTGIFTAFYKSFLTRFSQQYSLQQIVDLRTCDVTRACFVSFDPNVFYNPQADPVDINAFIDTENTYEILRAKKSVENECKQQQQQNITDEKQDVDAEVIGKIKTILFKAPKPMEKPPVYVPEQLNDIMTDLQVFLLDAGLTIDEIRNISYGKKIKTTIGRKQAEVNLFYGKRGFSVVQSPRTGTSPEMNELLAELVQAFLRTL